MPGRTGYFVYEGQNVERGETKQYPSHLIDVFNLVKRSSNTLILY